MFLQLNSSVALVWAHMGGDFDHMDDHMGGWAWSGWLFMILFLVLIVALVAWAISVSRGGSTRSGRNSAVAVLEERFARGELSPEEYRERRGVLEDR